MDRQKNNGSPGNRKQTYILFDQLFGNASMHRHISVKVYLNDFVIMVKLYVSPLNAVTAFHTHCYNVLKSYNYK